MYWVISQELQGAQCVETWQRDTQTRRDQFRDSNRRMWTCELTRCYAN